MNFRQQRVFILLAALVCALPGVAQSSWQIPAPVVSTLSGEEAHKHVVEVSRYYREDATPGFHQVALYIAEQAKRYGLSEVNIETYPSDGVTRHFGLKTRYAWNPRGAELWLTEPRLKLADFRDATTHLATWSQGADVIAEVVDIGEGKAADFEGKNVRGKIVFTSRTPADVQHEAVTRRGAVGIISYWWSRGRLAFPDQVNWLDVANNKLEETKTFGFVLSRRQGEAFKKRLQQGPVTVHAKVDAELGAGNLEVVSATIPGSDAKAGEVFLVAHICHFSPSSNDNASGVALLLEIARTWKALITSGAVPRPKRTVRFLWVPENYGSAAYTARHPGLNSRVKAMINLDMVGEDLEKCNAVFRIVRTPDSRPSYLADVLEHFTEAVASQQVVAPTGTKSGFRYTFNNYMGGSDHMWFNDAGVGVPAVMLTHWPDNFYHTNEDSPDKVDPSELRRVGLITLASASLVASADERGAMSLARRVALRARKRIAEELQVAREVAATDPALSESVRRRLAWLVEREARAIASAAAFGNAAAVDKLASEFRTRERAFVTDSLNAFTPPSKPAAPDPALAGVYRRQGRYLSTLWDRQLREAKVAPEQVEAALRFAASLPYGPSSAAELLNLTDGNTTLGAIRDVLESQRMDEHIFNEYFGDGTMTAPPRFTANRIAPDKLAEFVAVLEKAGLVSRVDAERQPSKASK